MEHCISLISAHAAIITVGITTTVAAGMIPPITAKSKTAELRKRFDMVEARHEFFVKRILPRLPEDEVKSDSFKVEKTEALLDA